MCQIIEINDEYIKLGQALKLSGLVSSGVEAKIIIMQKKVLVNGEICLMRGKKLYSNDFFEYNGQTFKIK